MADNGGVGGSVRERGSILVNVGAAIKTGGASIGGVVSVGPVGECGLASSVFFVLVWVMKVVW